MCDSFLEYILVGANALLILYLLTRELIVGWRFRKLYKLRMESLEAFRVMMLEAHRSGDHRLASHFMYELARVHRSYDSELADALDPLCDIYKARYGLH